MYREKLVGVAVKIETTSGTDSVPTAALNAVRVVGIPTLNWDFLEGGERPDVQTGQLGVVDRTTPAGRWGSIDLTVEARGGGSAGSAPDFDVLLRIAGHSKTTSAGVSVLYSTLDDNMETGTLYAWGAGKLFKLVGCVATMKFSVDALKRGFFTFTVTGRMVSDPTEAAIPAFTFDSVLPPLFQGAVANVGSWTAAQASDPLVLKSLAIDEQIKIEPRPSAGAADGHAGYAITDRQVRQTMVVEVPAIATYDAFAVAKAAGSSAPTTATQLGSTSGNRIKIQTGRWGLKAPKLGAQNGISTMTLEGLFTQGTAPTSSREINYLFD